MSCLGLLFCNMILFYLIFVRPEGPVISIQDLKISDKLRKFEAFMEFDKFISAFFLLCSVLLTWHLPSYKNSYFPPENQLPWQAFHVMYQIYCSGIHFLISYSEHLFQERGKF